MKELLVAVFEDEQTAFLAQAVFIRMKSELGIGTKDLLVVTKGDNGAFKQHVEGSQGSLKSCWDKLLPVFLNVASSDEVMDAAAIKKIRQYLVSASSVLFVRIDKRCEEKGRAYLRGLNGKIVSTTLKGGSFGHGAE